MILLDMDGVLCDWIGAVCSIFDEDPNDLDLSGDVCRALGITDEELWARIDGEGERFWAELEPYPWTGVLWSTCSTWETTLVCTSPSWHPSSLAGKLQWLNRHLGRGRAFRDYIMTPKKELLASREVLLIDDRDHQVQRFLDAGGQGLVFPQPWNSRRHEADNPMDAVWQALNPWGNEPCKTKS